MHKTTRIPIVASRDGSRTAPILFLPLVALAAALASPPACADRGYPPGLFENSPVVGPGSSGAAGSSGSPPPQAAPRRDVAPAAPSDPDAAWEAPGPVAPAPPSASSPAPNAYTLPPDAYTPPPNAYRPPSNAYAPRPYAYAPPRFEDAPPPYDDCTGVANRTFNSLEEVRRAHARCDRPYGAPPPRY